ncbi:hypothetical protein BB561_005601 [Smittium simulii]|uniref:Alpha/beta hydrolase fold-3 domain-containing protein n=1 Tax=Smittium simulii TaxID=133385 RepID=A0A2T9Y9L8_9FUNG|nr:hypothetical protein BB561_005601 [Smittium simulii]
MLDYLLGKPSIRVRRIQTLVITLLALILIKKKNPPKILSILQDLTSKYPFWKVMVVWSALLHLIEHGDDVFGLSDNIAAHILSSTDAGFWTAMFIRPKPLRDFLSIVFSIYYVFVPKKAEEKVRKFRSLITADHMRISWEKSNTNPLLRLLRWNFTENMPIRQATYLPNRLGDFDLHAIICSRNIIKPWNLKWWFNYDPSFGLEPGFKTSEENVLSALMYTEQKSFDKKSNGFSGKIKIDPNSASGVKPALCYIIYAHDKSLYKKSKRIILNFPGGGFVSMSPPCHDDYLSLWAKNVNAIVVSVDYAKSPEYPFPYAIDQCFEVYKSIVKSNGKCIGVELDYGEQLEVLIVGDSAGANITAATMFKILESDEPLPLPIGLVFIYGLFNFDIRAWMTGPEIDMLKGVTDTAHNPSNTECTNLNPSILESKDHLMYQSPLAIDKENSAYQSTALSWNSGVKPISETILFVKDEENNIPQDSNTSKNTSVNSVNDNNNTKNDLVTNPNIYNEKTRILQDQGKNTNNITEPSNNPQKKSAQNFLSMTSRFTYFSDMILTPEMMRALAILYIGPNNTPDFAKNYYLSPVVAPDELLARFPNTYFMCGEKDPLVDDTIILAGRIREAKSKIRAYGTDSNNVSAKKNNLNVNSLYNLRENGKNTTGKHKVKSSKSNQSSKVSISSESYINSNNIDKTDEENTFRKNKYKPYVRPGRQLAIDNLKQEIRKNLDSSSSSKNTHFYISDSSNPNSSENSESELSDSIAPIGGYKKKTFKMLRMTKFNDASNGTQDTLDSKPKSKGNSITKISSISSLLKWRSSACTESEIDTDKDVWDLTATKSKTELNQQPNLSAEAPDIVVELDADNNKQSDEINNKSTINDKELCSTIIKLKILKGMSHGFMQMGSILPEALSSINTIGEWMNELFCLEERLITSYSRCGSIASLNDFNSSTISMSTSEVFSDDRSSDLENSYNGKSSGYLDSPKIGINHLTSVVTNLSNKVKDKLFLVNIKNDKPAENNKEAKLHNNESNDVNEPKFKAESTNLNSALSAELNYTDNINSPNIYSQAEDNSSENLQDNSGPNYLKDNLTDLCAELNNNNTVEDPTKVLLNSNTIKVVDQKINLSKDFDSKKLNNKENIVIQADTEIQKNESNDVVPTQKSSKGAKSFKKNKVKSKGNSIDRHGNIVVTSVEMLRDRGSHLIENLRK